MEAKTTTTKTISNGTLGLRFMQNAQRAKQLKEVEAERAQVKDDAEWEVDPKIRDAWGPSSSSSGSQTIIHETSYLPFLFSSEASTSSEPEIQKPKGRRSFNKHGVEELEQQPAAEFTSIPTPDEQKRSKVHPRPKAISGGPSLFGFPADNQPSKPKSTKTAKQSIYDNTGVGQDLRNASKVQPSTPTQTPPPARATFLKPAGVDEPRSAKPSLDANAGSDIIQGARGKKSKRERPGTDGDEDTKRKKKKKQSVT